MKKKKGFTPEQVITMLGEAEVLLSQGITAVEATRKLWNPGTFPRNKVIHPPKLKPGLNKAVHNLKCLVTF